MYLEDCKCKSVSDLHWKCSTVGDKCDGANGLACPKQCRKCDQVQTSG